MFNQEDEDLSNYLNTGNFTERNHNEIDPKNLLKNLRIVEPHERTILVIKKEDMHAMRASFNTIEKQNTPSTTSNNTPSFYNQKPKQFSVNDITVRQKKNFISFSKSIDFNEMLKTSSYYKRTLHQNIHQMLPSTMVRSNNRRYNYRYAKEVIYIRYQKF